MQRFEMSAPPQAAVDAVSTTRPTHVPQAALPQPTRGPHSARRLGLSTIGGMVGALALLGSAALAQGPDDESRAGGAVEPSPGQRTVEPGTLDALADGLQQAAVSMLAASIAQIRDDAVRRGVDPLPPEVRAAFEGFLSPSLLDKVRWRVEAGGLSVPGGVLALGDTPALTAGHVIVFADAAATKRPLVWAHELHHVGQYDAWGLDGFAQRYLADAGAVEHAANEFVWQWRDAGGDIALPR